jgi:hypothetical protein
MAESDKKSGSFTVTDRRAFAVGGEPQETAPAADTPTKQGPPKQAPPESPKASGQDRAEREAAASLPPADFATLVLSLGSSAMAYMGESDAPDPKQPARNLPMAKHAIDLLSVLEEKTKGNLTSEEEQILESLLFDLRLRYVEAVKASTSAG